MLDQLRTDREDLLDVSMVMEDEDTNVENTIELDDTQGWKHSWVREGSQKKNVKMWSLTVPRWPPPWSTFEVPLLQIFLTIFFRKKLDI